MGRPRIYKDDREKLAQKNQVRRARRAEARRLREGAKLHELGHRVSEVTLMLSDPLALFDYWYRWHSAPTDTGQRQQLDLWRAEQARVEALVAFMDWYESLSTASQEDVLDVMLQAAMSGSGSTIGHGDIRFRRGHEDRRTEDHIDLMAIPATMEGLRLRWPGHEGFGSREAA